ncbi:MAG: hypothetical protein A3J69_01135 [Candidatus Levybacteria bacterium RIFCSPHIGHO2_02_FULL_42_12]|nr:MAG: hypothetical protein A2698_01700 [Candidatus Levybacteria bacterium RIFCSPHIGHO2_01_FULL_42_15]OGH33879.1 MAG: hypothetical protein A3J69_01135 [Candidatus Levybacteria bacterium RIFCSPHIGHO2_02_FULL_42_12]OGH43028.1 MAG: hypothetical protein A3B53_00145 [Candidatus Levybacteria bacterium RIFCSPLOWO2_01_FULL_42_15]
MKQLKRIQLYTALCLLRILSAILFVGKKETIYITSFLQKISYWEKQYQLFRALKRLLLVIVVSSILTTVYQFQKDIPLPKTADDIPTPKTLSLYDTNGTLLFSLFEKNKDVPEPIPDLLVRATETYYGRPIADLLAKRLLINNDAPMKHRVLSLKLSIQMSKKNLTSLYFQTTPFQDVLGAIGASKRFFNKPLSRLSEYELLFLATNQSDYPLPSITKQEAENKIENLSAAMQKNNAIPQSKLAKILAQKSTFSLLPAYKRAPHAVDFALFELRNQYHLSSLLQNETRVYTTIDASLQNELQKQILLTDKAYVTDMSYLGVLQQTAEVVVLIASSRYFENPSDRSFRHIAYLLNAYKQASKRDAITIIQSVQSGKDLSYVKKAERLSLSKYFDSSKNTDAKEYAVSYQSRSLEGIVLIQSPQKEKAFAQSLASIFIQTAQRNISLQRMQAALPYERKGVN